MKKYPVDDLFARKLDDWKPKPSPDLWKRIEDRQESKVRHITSWYWYAAASAVLMMVASYVVWQSQSKVSPGSIQVFATIDQKTESKVDRAYNRAFSADSMTTLENPEIKGKENGTLVGDVSLSSKVQPPMAKTKPPIRPQVYEPNPISDPIEVAVIQKNETNPEFLISDSKSKTLLQSLDARPEITKEISVNETQARVIIAHIETDDVHQEDQKSSKFIRILRQLKNAKQGEAIEWDEVGFNPRKLMARADERLRNEEEKVSKRYQELKDKTKL